MKIAIIGTAGRKEDAPKMSWSLYDAMFAYAVSIIAKVKESGERIDLVSGGAAWSDHVAVSCFLAGKADSLTLYLPTQFDVSKSRYVDSNDIGRTANYYHDAMSQHTPGRRNSMTGISKAINVGATVNIVSGFKERNIPVGKVDMILAFTFGTGEEPKDGGTARCWHNSKATIKVHVGLMKLIKEEQQ